MENNYYSYGFSDKTLDEKYLAEQSYKSGPLNSDTVGLSYY